MRIDGFSITNFRGLRRAEVSGLSTSSLVTVSGPNGSGKSLLFEAIALVAALGTNRWTDLYGHLVGPWDDHASLTLTLRIAPEERELLAEFARRAAISDEVPEEIVRRAVFHRSGQAELPGDQWSHLLHSLEALRELPFLQLDYLPADRHVSRGEHPTVNPSILGYDQQQGFRNQIVGSFIQQRNIVNLSGIAPVLASLDYTDLLAHREGVESNGDFDALSDAFFLSTSKRIARPSLDPRSPLGSTLNLSTPSGMEHSLDQLSSGEQEVLGLMYFVRRLSASGGVLLIDEPELHLHPALQRSLFSILENIADRAQVVISTHSPRLVVATTLDSVLHMTPASTEDTNQLARMDKEEARLALLDALSVHPIEVIQNDLLVVVEGTTDVGLLEALMPVELGRAVVRAAGSARQVEEACRALGAQGSIRFLGIRDRDVLSTAEADELRASIPGLFVWPSRMLENELLRTPLIHRTFERAGRAMAAEEVEKLVKSLASRQRDQVIAQKVDHSLRQSTDYEHGSSLSLDGLRRYLNAVQEATALKLSRIDELAAQVTAQIDETWDEQWFDLMDGKRVLADLVAESPFKSKRVLVDAIIQAVREDSTMLPAGIESLSTFLLAQAIEELDQASGSDA